MPNSLPAPDPAPDPVPGPAPAHQRRPRYAGKNPRRFEEKYKEHNPEQYGETVAKVLESGKTPAGTHRPILVPEILELLNPKPGQRMADCTLGYGGHAREILKRLVPGGHLLGLDADPVELPKTEARLRALGYGPEAFTAVRTNYAGLPGVLARLEWPGVDGLLADLGVSSMQLDDPARGFSTKNDGPLDMRMNPQRGRPAAVFLEKTGPDALRRLFEENADEPRAAQLATALAGRSFATTAALARTVRETLTGVGPETRDLAVRRVFQALRIAVNEEFTALETLLRLLPSCLNPGGIALFLTFHSGEDRRVKHALEAGLAAGAYASVSTEVIRPGPEERRDNSRSTPAKLRWARRAG